MLVLPSALFGPMMAAAVNVMVVVPVLTRLTDDGVNSTPVPVRFRQATGNLIE